MFRILISLAAALFLANPLPAASIHPSETLCPSRHPRRLCERSGPAASALAWEHRQLECHPAPGNKEARAEFAFTNTSAQSVTIDSVRSSCGCTTVALEKKVYAPGEKGHVTAVFTLGHRRGVQAKGIQVNIHGESEPTILTMLTRIPELLQIEPQFIYWTVGEPAAPKTIRLLLPGEAGLQLGKVSSSDPSFSATLATVKEGKEYRLLVKPGAVDKSALAVLTIDTILPNRTHHAFQAYAQVKRVRPPATP